MKVAIFGSRFQSEKLNQVLNVFDTLNKYEADIYICQSFYDFLITVMTDIPKVNGIIGSGDFSADFALSIGGDGTYLRTAHRIGNRGIPIVGINTGRLGFLADVESVEIEDVIRDLYKNFFKISKLGLLQLKINGEPFTEIPGALNDIAFLKRDTSSMIDIHVSVNGEYLNGYQADGLVVATPTGSTAYALSTGGPIIMPGSKNILIAAVAPHNLTVRPIVLDDKSVIDLEIESRSQNFLVSIDGYSFSMPCTAKLQVYLADFKINAVRRYNHSFTQTLRKKLMWGIDPRDDNR
jgi:NAD+ kinase